MIKKLLSGIIGLALYTYACFAGKLPFAIGVLIITLIGTYELISAHQRAPVPAPKHFNVDIPEEVEAAANPAVAYLGLIFPWLAYLSPIHILNGDKIYGACLSLLVIIFAFLVIHAARTGRTIGRLRPAR